MTSIILAILFAFGGPSECEELYHDFHCYLVLYFIDLLADVLGELNTLKKTFQKENLDLTKIKDAIKIVTQSLSRKFLVDEDEEIGVNTKFVAQFLDISRSGEIHFLKLHTLVEKLSFMTILCHFGCVIPNIRVNLDGSF